jgi:YHS domain-containing protein
MLSLILAFAPLAALAADPAPFRQSHTGPRDTSHYNLEPGKPAIQGYDPVAYFPDAGGKALKGKAQFAHEHRGVVYHFGTKENLERFLADPDRYEPAYGGWCASAMADGGRKVEIDPKNFKVTNGRLFLFYKSLFQDALTYWNKDEPKHTAVADDFWRTLTGEEPRR